MASNHIRFNNQDYTQREGEIACALSIYLRKSDETIGTILGFRRSGIGGPPIPCAGLVSFLQGRDHAAYRRVYNNGAYWEPEANRTCREWMGAVSQKVRRYGANDP